ncbi:putative multidrug resistance protein [Pistacia vera]|uniref:putative multidrug resistance protein n=1 Tax=Pistacia vera TaxID=55513 RepID=UPI0012639986|nr:putative multidrug resistance protein [Pistacia vera]
MIKRVPKIDSADQQGKTVSNFKGDLEFKDIDFAYPSRIESLVLKKFNLRVTAGQTVGLVGKSGSGKSTVVNLLERFYNPIRGEIYLDDIDIRSLQLKWLRSQMGLVSQEAILFATTIKENILFGKEEASIEEIIKAAKAANAHNFINQLPNGYDTMVGQLGIQMSEGQKQRISIARALLRDPKILLLDESTSALDSHSEKAVQDALDQASLGRTTIIIAHRLSALRNADFIAIIQSGKVVETCSHYQLMENSSCLYSSMVQLQRTFINDGIASTSKGIELNSSISIDKASSRTEKTENISALQSFSHDLQGDHKDSPPLWHLLCMASPEWKSPEWKSTVLGCIGAFCYGLIQPLHSFCLGGILSVYIIDDHSEIKSQTRIYCFAFISFAIFAFITNVFQHYYFGIMGESLTKRVRETLFVKILTFEIEWFDQENNNSGAVCSRLATDATMVRTLVADRLSLLAQNMSSMVLAIVLGMVLSWKLALIAISMQPFIIGAFYTKATMMRNMSRKLVKAQNKSGELASEAVGNHRIITAFYSQEKILKLHELTQISPKKESNRQSWYAGIGLLVSQFLTAANPAVIFWCGGKLLYAQDITYKHLFQTFFVLVSTGRVIAETGSMTADLSKGTSALKSIFEILKTKSKIDPDDSNAIKPQKLNGDREFKDVDFFYPSRPKQILLKHLNLKIDVGEVVALLKLMDLTSSSTI